MAIVLRQNKSLPLTYEEMDGNFIDLNTRLNSIENSSYVNSVNGLTGAITLSTAEITESGNLYFTTARANSAFDTRLSSKSTTDLSEGTNLYFTNARADARIALQTGSNLDLSQVTTDDLPQGITNLYASNATIDARISAASIDDLSDVQIGTPTLNYVLTWNGTRWVPAAAPGATGGEANTASNLNSGFELFVQKVGVDLQFRSLESGQSISMTQDAERITINFDNTVDLNMNSNNITNLADPTLAQHAATKAYVDANAGISAIYVEGDSGAPGEINNGGTITIVGTTDQIQTVSDGAGDITLSLPSSINVNSNTATALQTARTIQLTGDVTGSASFDGSANINIVTSRAANSVALGTDTTGIYVADLTAGTGITISGGTQESANVTVSIGQAVETNSNVTFNDLTLSGNLTVNGTTTTVDTTNMSVADLLIYLGNGRTGVPSGDAGLIIERGDLNNAFIGYDESADQFVMGTGTFTGTSTGDLVVSKGTLSVGSTVVDNVTIDGNTVSATAGDLTLTAVGNISANTNRITNVTDPVNAQDAATKNYIDTELSSLSSTLSLAGDTGTDNLTVGVDTLTFTGGTNIDTTVTDNTVTIAVSGTVADATNATKVATVANSTNAVFYPTFVANNNGVSGNEIVYTDAGISYNPSSNILTVAGSVDSTATSAQYADLAEKYTADEDHEPGTVLQVSTLEDSEMEAYDGGIVAGVVSTQPAYLMNNGLENGIEVALVGRVPVKVAGIVRKGQAVFAVEGGWASVNGTGNIVGIALASKTDEGVGLVECLLKI